MNCSVLVLKRRCGRDATGGTGFSGGRFGNVVIKAHRFGAKIIVSKCYKNSRRIVSIFFQHTTLMFLYSFKKSFAAGDNLLVASLLRYNDLAITIKICCKPQKHVHNAKNHRRN